jgi:hypothetical protein
MLTHPVSLLGWLIFGIGFLMLLSWVPTNVPGAGFGQLSQSVYNAHKAEISKATMLLGAVLAIVGTIVRGFEFLAEKVAAFFGDEMASVNQKPYPTPTISEHVSDEQETVLVKDRQGRNREVKVMEDGTAVVQTITGLKTFPSVDAVKNYLA